MADVNTARNREAHRTLHRWSRTFESIGSQGPTKRAMSAIGVLVVSSTIERMDKEMSPSGRAHRALTPGYVARKVADGYSPRIWQRTGESKRKTQVLRSTRKSVIIAINTPYSGWADTDGRVPRPVLGVDAQDRKAINNILTRDLKQQIDKGT